MHESLQQKIEKALGLRIRDLRYLSPGNQAKLYHFTTDQGHQLVAKCATTSTANLELEGWMLDYLAQKSELPVPDVYWSEPELLVMEALENGGTRTADTEIEAADHLAALHQIEGPSFGLERDTLIGALHQPNPPTQDWHAFFIEHRLLHMARAALEEGRIDTSLMRQLEKLCKHLPTLLGPSSTPRLIHGDLWQGNMLTNEAGRISGYIDPAIYYADPEIELAFTTLFHTFGDRFFDRYQEHHPIREGFFDSRRDLYNLYPLLVHVRLFGGGYVGQVVKIIQRHL